MVAEEIIRTSTALNPLNNKTLEIIAFLITALIGQQHRLV